MIDQIEKYNYYVERLLLLNIPTHEPTEFVQISPSFAPSSFPLSFAPTYAPTFAPTYQTTLSVYPDLNGPELKYIIVISIATSIFTTCCVICTSYYFAMCRKNVRLRYLRSIASSHSSDYSDYSDSSSISSQTDSETLHLEDIYRTSEEKDIV